ncbi:TrbC/VirB2 family protein [Labrys sp. 22185]|uniref:TrbC/VirB2 family protein n=1 Tax=Labrys sp. 22185 TaxID=3453888 RepID=UPI003F8626AC
MTKLFGTRAVHFGMLALLVVLAVGKIDPALAQTSQAFQPLNTMASDVLSFMTGSFAVTCATIAIAVLGFIAFRGIIPWAGAISVIVGIVFIFGGAQIVQGMSGGLGGG